MKARTKADKFDEKMPAKCIPMRSAAPMPIAKNEGGKQSDESPIEQIIENGVKRVMEGEDENIGVPTPVRVAIRGLIRGSEPRTGLPKIGPFTGSV